MEKDDWYFAVGTLLGVLALFGVPWKEVFGKAQAAMRNPRRDIFMVLALLGSLGMSCVGWYQSSHRDLLHWRMTQGEEELVYGRTYRSESVVIDGKKFDHCTFDNATLIFHGLAPTDFEESTWKGNIYVRTDNDAAKGFARISDQLGKVLSNRPGTTLKIASVDKNGNIVELPTPSLRINK